MGPVPVPGRGAGDEHRARRGHGEERGKDAQPGALPSSTSRPTRRDLCWFHSDSSSLGFAARHASTIGKSLDARPHLPVRNGSAVLTSRRRYKWHLPEDVFVFFWRATVLSSAGQYPFPPAPRDAS
jgi:hypothetical protein